MSMEVLLVENHDLGQSESLAPTLEKQGYRVSVVHTPEVALEQVQIQWPDLVVFNYARNLSLGSFQENLNWIDLKIPHVVVSDQKSIEDQLSDDTILIAPGKQQQLAQGIKKATSGQADRFVRLPHLIIDCHQHRILRREKYFSLTPKEFKLLYLLISNQDQVLSRKTIMHEVWETDYLGDTRTLDVHIRWLREKIEDNPSQPRRLITVRGVGYRFMAQQPE